MALPALKKEILYTYEDYLKWDDNERWEIIDGIAYNMSPAPSRLHQKVSLILTNKIYNHIKGKECEVYYSPFDVRLPDANEPDEDVKSVVQPDIVVICDKSKLDEKGCRGAPDWIIEIVSPNTVVRDLKEKLLLYERHKVKEYWIVHLTDKIVMVYLLRDDGKYKRAMVYADDDVINSNTVEGLSISLKELFEGV